MKLALLLAAAAALLLAASTAVAASERELLTRRRSPPPPMLVGGGDIPPGRTQGCTAPAKMCATDPGQSNGGIIAITTHSCLCPAASPAQTRNKMKVWGTVIVYGAAQWKFPAYNIAITSLRPEAATSPGNVALPLVNFAGAPLYSNCGGAVVPPYSSNECSYSGYASSTYVGSYSVWPVVNYQCPLNPDIGAAAAAAAAVSADATAVSEPAGAGADVALSVSAASSGPPVDVGGGSVAYFPGCTVAQCSS